MESILVRSKRVAIPSSFRAPNGLRGRSIGALLFFRALQGLSTGAGIVVSRAVIRDMFAPADAQRVMSQVTIFFGVASAIAPIIGGWRFVRLGWHSIF
jgi:DHA1 family bicyclomycin/chloramphenicol resistance-like MFS transporter